MEGMLFKWTNYFSFWKKRYFVLRGNILYYYVKKGDRPRGRIHLAVSILNESPEDVTKFEIDTGVSIVYLKAQNKEMKKEWINAIKRSKLEPAEVANKIPDLIPIDYTGDVKNSLGCEDDKIIRRISDIKFTVDRLREDHNNNNNNNSKNLKQADENSLVISYGVRSHFTIGTYRSFNRAS
jgi:hypothetical protein